MALLVVGCSGPAATPQRSPTTVIDQDGSGTARLPPFTSTGPYRVDLAYSCSGLSALSIVAYGVDGLPAETLLTMSPVTGTSTTTYGAHVGQTVLEVGALGCSWHAKVTG